MTFTSLVTFFQSILIFLGLATPTLTLPAPARDTAHPVVQQQTSVQTNQQDITGRKASATIDQKSLTTTSPNPTISGGASGSSALYVHLFDNTYKGGQDYESVFGAAQGDTIRANPYPVTISNGHWSATFDKSYDPRVSLGSGSYTVVVYDSVSHALLTTDTLTVNRSPTALAATLNTANWKTYRNNKFHFELQYPNDVTVTEKNVPVVQSDDDWVRVTFQNENKDLNLVFFVGQSPMGGVGEGYSSFFTKKILAGGKEVEESLLDADGVNSQSKSPQDQVILSVFTGHFKDRYDNFSARFKRSQIETLVPQIESIIATLKYTE